MVFVFTLGQKGALANVKMVCFVLYNSLRSETSNHRWILTTHSNPISNPKVLSIFQYHLDSSNSLHTHCHHRRPPSLIYICDFREVVASQFLTSYHPTSTHGRSKLYDLGPSSLFGILAHPSSDRAHSATAALDFSASSHQAPAPARPLGQAVPLMQSSLPSTRR